MTPAEIAASLSDGERGKVLAGKVPSGDPFAARGDIWHRITFRAEFGLTPLGELVRQCIPDDNPPSPFMIVPIF